MDFFCAKCQKRHSIKEISADMWSICQDKVKRGVSSLFGSLFDELSSNGTDTTDVSDLLDDLVAFLNKADFLNVDTPAFKGKARVNAFFALNYTNIRQLSGIHTDGNTITGTFVIDLKTILDLYERAADTYSAQTLFKVRRILSADWLSRPVCQQEIVAFFEPNGVIDKVTDPENVPFPKGDTMMGFTHICPHCGREMSRAVGAAEEIVVALAGSPRAGKSSCMISMISSLLNGSCPGIRVVPMPHDRKWKALSNEVNHYQHCAKITKNPENQIEVPSHSLLIQLSDRDHTQRVLTIVDMPGELWQSGNGLTADFFSQYAGIYENIDCIWLVVSKATVRLSQAGEISERVLQELVEYTSEDVDIIRKANPTNLTTNLGMLKSHLAARSHKPMPPTIVIVSKPDHMVSANDAEDTVKNALFPPAEEDVANRNTEELSRILKCDSKYLYGMTQWTLCQHAANVRSYIEDINPSFLPAVEDNCQDHFYVSVSPYGRPALERGENMESPTPYHELIPFLWTLGIMGAVKIYQNCHWLKLNFFHKVVSEENTRELVAFHHSEQTAAAGRRKPDQATEDRRQVYATIRNNLLMNGPKYAEEAVFQHARPW